MKINPFEDDIVMEPRRIEVSNDTLNKEAFDDIDQAFQQLLDRPLPRVEKAPPALLVTSAEPGFGKSHLIGRLFQRLDDTATLIYLRPFQDRDTCWSNILHKIVSELDYPDRPDALACRPGEATQLDALVCCVLANLFASCIENKTLTTSHDPTETVKALRETPLDTMRSAAYQDYLQQHFQSVLDSIEAELQRAGVQLNSGDRQAWLKILVGYLCGNSTARKSCLSWIKNQPLESDELKQLSLRVADNPNVDSPFAERNEICFQRIRDLCLLSAFYRPFLFCFDQTELYGHSSELAKSFGVVVSRLRREAVNHLTLAAGNFKPWETAIFCHFEEADRHAFRVQPTRLVGVDQAQAREIAEARLRAVGVKDDRITEFLGRPFFSELFTGARKMRGIRELLRECSVHWANPTEIDLEKLFASYRLKVTASPKGLDFDAGVLQWAFTNVLPLATEFKTAAFRSNRGYLTLKWASDQQAYLFCFEEGGNFMRWRAILSEADRYHHQSKEKGQGPVAKTLFFRLPSQGDFGDRVSTKMKEAKACARCVRITPEGAAELYAAHDFYADLRQGNHPELKEEDVLKFLSEYFKPRLKRFVDPVDDKDPPVKLPGPLADAIRDALRNIDLVPWPTLQKRLLTKNLSPTLTDVVAACATIAAEVKVLATPSNAVFRWIK